MNVVPLPSSDRRIREPAACHSGFTVLELMLVITIVAILAGIGVPSFSRFIAEQRVHAAASDLQAAFVRARSEAIRLNRDVVLAPLNADAGWESGWTATSPALPGVEVMRRDPVTAVTLSTGQADVTYRGSGRLRGQTGGAAFEVASKSDAAAKKRCVRIEPSGQPTIRDGGC
jgi:type IV fimbrial biogenesis protein FimT